MARQKGPGEHGRVREAAPARYAAEPTPENLTGVLLDSDVVIDILRGRRPIVDAARWLDRRGVPTYCTPVTLAEVHAGLRPGEETLTETYFEARGTVVLDAVIGRRAGSYLALYSKSHGLEIADALVAAAAALTGLKLWTLNRRHYPMPDVAFYEP